MAGALVLGACAVKSPLPVAGAAGDLDPTFGIGGRVTTDFGGFDQAHAVAVQPDGKVVVAGSSILGFSSGHVVLARYNPDGSLDTTFGMGGTVTTDFGGGFSAADALLLQPDGKVVVAGDAVPASGIGLDLALARYNPDGSLDATFGTGGRVVSGFAEFANGLALQPDGRIVAVGGTGPGGDFALARYNANGSLDPAFGLGGTVLTDFGGADSAAAVTLQPDGRIIAAGQAQAGLFGLARYNPNGSLDPSFGAGGKVTNPGSPVGAGALAVIRQGAGRIVASGFIGPDFALARYNADGSLDATFGMGGTVTTNFGGTRVVGGESDQARALALQPDGRIVAAGAKVNHASAAENGFALARYNPDGSRDSTFGTGGEVVTTAFPDGAYAVVLQPDGTIIAAGSAAGNFAVARYLGATSTRHHPEPPGDD
jgi:uncharacterized delta-60 repeat protein